MASYIEILLTSLIFLLVSAYFVSGLQGTSFVLINPITLVVIAAELLIAIASPQVEILGSGAGETPKRLALAAFFGTTLFTTGFDILYNSMPVFYGLICVVVYVALGFSMIEAGKG